MQDFELGGGKQDGSRMIVVCEMYACLLGGLGACPPQENFEFIYPSYCNLGQISKHFDDTYLRSVTCK